jgi:sarcosine oxidase subunit gamma
MLEHRTPLEQVALMRNSQSIELTGLRAVPVVGRGFLLIQGDPTDAVLINALLQETGVRVPGPIEAHIHGDYALLCLTPREWLLQLPAAGASAVQTVQTSLAARLTSTLAAVTDMSDAFACFDVSGNRAVDVLMTGCSLDLRPHAFAPGQVARTTVADTPTVIWKPGSSHLFHCLIDRSFAGHFCSWLADSVTGW